MKNQDSSKTEMRSQRMPTQSPSHQETGQSANALPIGTRLGEFEIVDLIGEGGFGIVYLAYDHSLERHVALKEYMPSGLATRTIHMAVHVRSKQHIDTFAVGLKSFINEARMLAKFDSPALVKVHSFWEGNGTAYMVMPHYEGVTLKQALHEKRIKPTEAWLRVLLADLLDAAEILHRANCLHRDIAPDNILLLKDGRPLLLDFGAARRVIGDLTQLFTAFLKPGFAPIEQYADIPGLRQGAWTDIYALAAVAYYLISGDTPPAAVARMVRDEMKPAREIGKGAYSDSFLAALDKALAVKPEHRYQSIAELRRALDIMETVPRSLPRSEAPMASVVASAAAPTSASTATTAPPLPANEAASAGMMQNIPAGPGKMPPVNNDAEHLAAGNRSPAHPGLERQFRANGERDVRLNIPVPEPRKKPEMPPPRNKNAGQQASPQARQGLQGERAEPHLQPDHASKMSMAGGPHMPPPRVKPTAIKPKKTNKLAWLVLTMLFAVGIGGGAYLGSNRTWEGLTERSITASGSVPFPQPQPTEPMASAGANDNAGSVGADDIAAAPNQPQDKAVTPDAPAEPPQAAAPAPTEAPAPTPPATQTPPDQALAAAAPATEAPKPAADNSDKKTQPASRAPSETELWRLASASNKPGAYEDYLSAFPKGRYATVARLRLDRLQARQAPTSASEPRAPVQSAKAKPEAPSTSARSATQSAEELAWTRATTIDNPPAYQAYLNEYPRGGYAALAKDRLASMKATPPVAAASQQPKSADQAPVAPAEPTRQAAIKPPAMQASKPVPQAAPKPDPVQVDTDLPVITGKQTLRFGDQTMTGDFDVDPTSGLVSGKVRITWNNGNQFEGALVRGSKEGKGKFTWANGQRYSGDWSRDLPNGRGRFVFVDGSRYEGDVRDGTPHGQGSYWFKGGNVYSGDWVRGKSHGYGRYTFANGSFWEGEFRDDKRTENGKMGFPDSPVRTATSTAANSGVQSAGAQAAGAGAADN